MRATPARRMVPIRDPSPVALTRRMATVVSWVPETARTLPRTSRDCAPPVPTISREDRSRPASCHDWAGGEGTPPFGLFILSLTSLDRGHNLDHGSVGEPGVRPGAAGDDLAVDGYGDALRGRDELGHQVREGCAGRKIARISVDGEHHVVSWNDAVLPGDTPDPAELPGD